MHIKNPITKIVSKQFSIFLGGYHFSWWNLKLHVYNVYIYIYIYRYKIKFHQYYHMGVDQNIVAGVLLEMTLRPPLRFLALFRVFIVFHYID